ncbi:MAG: hypothetical protein KAV87_30615 [Desulfobacteraceae bacterium]|nr:hypothetical protein [Desulfobacteraceae bacterium]
MNVERLAQSETYYPGHQEAHSGVTGVAFGIRRVSDGHWYDFNDSTFKAAAWTTKHQTLAEDDNGLWTYDTGWAIPDADTVYHLQWKITDATGSFYELGPKIVVNDTYMFTAAKVNTEVCDVLKTDTLGEPAQGAPAATASIEAKVAWLYKLARNKVTNDGTDIKVYNDAGAVVDHKAGVSEAAGTVERSEFVTGP